MGRDSRSKKFHTEETKKRKISHEFTNKRKCQYLTYPPFMLFVSFMVKNNHRKNEENRGSHECTNKEKSFSFVVPVLAGVFRTASAV
jgi:hypothetical protein